MASQRTRQDQIGETGLDFGGGQRRQRDDQRQERGNDRKIKITETNNAAKRHDTGHRRTKEGAHKGRQ